MYTIRVSSAMLVPAKEDKSILEWATDEIDEAFAGQFETVEECLQDISNWGSRWCLYPSIFIEDEDGSEIWSSVLVEYECPCCGHSEYDYITERYNGT